MICIISPLKELYGFYPISHKVMDYYVAQVYPNRQTDMVFFVLDKEGKVVGFTAIMPSLASL